MAGAGAAGYGAASLTGHAGWDLPVLALGLGSGVVVAVTGERAKRRLELQDRLVEALAPLLGVRQLDRRTVRLRSWTNGWPGIPGRVSIRYAPGAPDSDPLWKSGVVEVVTGRLLAKYEVAGHNQLKCQLDLRLTPLSGVTAGEPSYAQVRAERAITGSSHSGV